LRIALDPGHLGGKWAKMEERWFPVGDQPPVTEGDRLYAFRACSLPRLRKLGAKVFFVHTRTGPVTLKRPDDFKELAKKNLDQNARVS